MVRPYIQNLLYNHHISIYRESQNKLYLPRFFGIETYGKPDGLNITGGESININFNGSLRDYQTNIIDIYLNNVNDKDGGGGLLEIPCGRGKTVMALKLIERLKVKTLVIVLKVSLEQWIERIKQFYLTKVEYRPIIDIEGKDSYWYVTILSMKDIITMLKVLILWQKMNSSYKF